MVSRFLAALNAGLLCFVISTNTHAAIASANVMFDWTTLDFTASDGLSVVMIGPTGDDGSALADGGLFESGTTIGFGGLDLTSLGPSSSATLQTTTESINASSDTTFGFGGAIFERFFSFEALSGSGSLTLSVDIEIQAEVQGLGTSANSDALFGYQIGNSGVVASLAGLEMYGNSGDQSQTLSTSLSFSLFMTEGDIVNMFAEGAAEVTAEVTTVPVPPAVVLFGSGIIGLIGMARRKAT